MSSENIKSIVSALVIVACLAFLGFLAYEKVDNAVVIGLAVVPTLIAYFTRAPDKKDPPPVTGVVVTMGAGTLLAIAIFACNSLPTPKEQSAVVTTTCKVLTAFAGSALEQSICATTEDLISIEESVRSDRSDAGASRFAARTTSCQIIGTVCVTDAELAKTIASRKDGGK